MNKDEVSVLDLLNAARLVREFVGAINREIFFADLRSQSSIYYQLIVMGEAVKRLSDDFRTRYPQIPWRKIAGFRDVLIHQYDQLDVEEIWNITQ